MFLSNCLWLSQLNHYMWYCMLFPLCGCSMSSLVAHHDFTSAMGHVHLGGFRQNFLALGRSEVLKYENQVRHIWKYHVAVESLAAAEADQLT